MLLLPTLLLYALGLLLTGIGSRLASRCATWCGALCGLPMWMVGGTLVAGCTARPQRVLALLAAALPVQGEPDEPLLGRRTGFGVLGIILCVAAASLVVALNWTPINYETLFGMQGRNWLHVLPLALLLVKENRSVCARRDLSRGAALAVTACTL